MRALIGTEIALVMVAAIESHLALRTAIKGSVLAKESSDEDLQAHVEGLIDAGFSECASSLNRWNASIEYLALRGDPKSLITGRWGDHSRSGGCRDSGLHRVKEDGKCTDRINDWICDAAPALSNACRKTPSLNDEQRQ